MTLEGIAELYDHMRKETILKQFCDLQKIKYRESINQFYIVIDRKQYTAKTRRHLIDKLFEKYCGDAVTTLEQAYLEWMHWRASINTSSKTLKENKNEWKHYIQDSSLAKMQVAKIEIPQTLQAPEQQQRQLHVGRKAADSGLSGRQDGHLLSGDPLLVLCAFADQ